MMKASTPLYKILAAQRSQTLLVTISRGFATTTTPPTTTSPSSSATTAAPTGSATTAAPTSKATATASTSSATTGAPASKAAAASPTASSTAPPTSGTTSTGPAKATTRPVGATTPTTGGTKATTTARPASATTPPTTSGTSGAAKATTTARPAGVTTTSGTAADTDRQIRFHKARFHDYILSSNPEKAIDHFLALRMLKQTQKNVIMYEEIMREYLKKKDLPSVRKISAYLQKDKVKWSKTIRKMIWYVYIKSKDIATASKLFEKKYASASKKAKKKVLSSFAQVLTMCGYAGQAKKVIASRSPRIKQARPYNFVLSRYSKKGDTAKALAWFEKMKQWKVKVDGKSYAEVISCLIKDKKLDEALKMYEEMKEKGLASRVAAEKLGPALLQQGNKAAEAMSVLEGEKDAQYNVDVYKQIAEGIEKGTVRAKHLDWLVERLLAAKVQDDNVYAKIKSLIENNKDALEAKYFKLKIAAEELKYDENLAKQEKENPCKQQ